MSQAEIDRGTVEYILTKLHAGAVHEDRRRCAAGKAQEVTDKSRALGSETLLNAVDECPVVLMRQGRDGTLLQLYREVMVELVGQPTGFDAFPSAIGTAVMGGARQVSLPGGKAASVSAALAFDAGFTVAYQRRERLSSPAPELTKLRPIVDRCLRQREPDLGLCFAVGTALGTLAVNGRPVTTL